MLKNVSVLFKKDINKEDENKWKLINYILIYNFQETFNFLIEEKKIIDIFARTNLEGIPLIHQTMTFCQHENYKKLSENSFEFLVSKKLFKEIIYYFAVDNKSQTQNNDFKRIKEFVFIDICSYKDRLGRTLFHLAIQLHSNRLLNMILNEIFNDLNSSFQLIDGDYNYYNQYENILQNEIIKDVSNEINNFDDNIPNDNLLTEPKNSNIQFSKILLLNFEKLDEKFSELKQIIFEDNKKSESNNNVDKENLFFDHQDKEKENLADEIVCNNFNLDLNFCRKFFINKIRNYDSKYLKIIVFIDIIIDLLNVEDFGGYSCFISANIFNNYDLLPNLMNYILNIIELDNKQISINNLNFENDGLQKLIKSYFILTLLNSKSSILKTNFISQMLEVCFIENIKFLSNCISSIGQYKNYILLDNILEIIDKIINRANNDKLLKHEGNYELRLIIKNIFLSINNNLPIIWNDDLLKSNSINLKKTLISTNEISLLHTKLLYNNGNQRIKARNFRMENSDRLKVLLNDNTGILMSNRFRDLSEKQFFNKDAYLSDITRTHNYNYIKSIRDKCRNINFNFKSEKFDPDTDINSYTYKASIVTAQTSIESVISLASESTNYNNCFVVTRPPGHHAGYFGRVDKNMEEYHISHGFCFINNIIIAASYLRYHYKYKIAIVDFDVHHGNGTQQLIQLLNTEKQNLITFRNKNLFGYSHTDIAVCTPWLDYNDKNEVLFISLHGYDKENPDKFYPCCGSDLENTQESDKIYPGGILNIPLNKETKYSHKYRGEFTSKVLKRLHIFKPDFILVSAGFDGHENEQINHDYSRLTEHDYLWITNELCDVADKYSNGRICSFLEGGYNIYNGLNSSFSMSVSYHFQGLINHTIAKNNLIKFKKIEFHKDLFKNDINDKSVSNLYNFNGTSESYNINCSDAININNGIKSITTILTNQNILTQNYEKEVNNLINFVEKNNKYDNQMNNLNLVERLDSDVDSIYEKVDLLKRKRKNDFIKDNQLFTDSKEFKKHAFKYIYKEDIDREKEMALRNNFRVKLRNRTKENLNLSNIQAENQNLKNEDNDKLKLNDKINELVNLDHNNDNICNNIN